MVRAPRIETYAGADDGLRDLVQAVDDLRREVRALRAEVKAVRQAIADRPTTSVAAIHDLGSKRYRLVAPLQVVIEDYGSEVWARVPDLETRGKGATEPEAISALKKDLVDLYEDLASTPPDQLGSAPKRRLMVLRRFFVANGQA